MQITIKDKEYSVIFDSESDSTWLSFIDVTNSCYEIDEEFLECNSVTKDSADSLLDLLTYIQEIGLDSISTLKH